MSHTHGNRAPLAQSDVQRLVPGRTGLVCESCGRALAVVRAEIKLAPCFFEQGSDAFHIAGGLLYVNALVDIETWRPGDVDYVPDRHRLHAEWCEEYRRLWKG